MNLLLLKKLNKPLFFNVKLSYAALFFVLFSINIKAQVASNYNFQELRKKISAKNIILESWVINKMDVCLHADLIRQ